MNPKRVKNCIVKLFKKSAISQKLLQICSSNYTKYFKESPKCIIKLGLKVIPQTAER